MASDGILLVIRRLFTEIMTWLATKIGKGAFKYYVIKEVGGWVGQMMMFDDKVGGWEWLNDDLIKKYTRQKKTFVCVRRKQGCNLKTSPV